MLNLYRHQYADLAAQIAKNESLDTLMIQGPSFSLIYYDVDDVPDLWRFLKGFRLPRQITLKWEYCHGIPTAFERDSIEDFDSAFGVSATQQLDSTGSEHHWLWTAPDGHSLTWNLDQFRTAREKRRSESPVWRRRRRRNRPPSTLYKY